MPSSFSYNYCKTSLFFMILTDNGAGLQNVCTYIFLYLKVHILKIISYFVNLWYKQSINFNLVNYFNSYVYCVCIIIYIIGCLYLCSPATSSSSPGPAQQPRQSPLSASTATSCLVKWCTLTTRTICNGKYISHNIYL
jgi:hypothetical protein